MTPSPQVLLHALSPVGPTKVKREAFWLKLYSAMLPSSKLPVTSSSSTPSTKTCSWPRLNVSSIWYSVLSDQPVLPRFVPRCSSVTAPTCPHSSA